MIEVVNIMESSMKVDNVKLYLQSYLKVEAYVHNMQCWYTTTTKNIVIERRNRTLMKMVTSMINYSNVPLLLWMYVLKSVSYLLTRVPSKVVPKTPYELWKGRKPSMRHLDIWGCLTKVRVYNPRENKLDARTISDFLLAILINQRGTYSISLILV